jgi:glycosyltransferase involved in cell wall biosynthesis
VLQRIDALPHGSLTLVRGQKSIGTGYGADGSGYVAGMRIGIVAPPWLPVPPPAYGGTEVVLAALVGSLTRAGHEVVLAAHPDSTCTTERVDVAPVTADIAMGNGLHEARHVLMAYDALGDVDVVHDHTNLGPLVMARRTSIPIVTTNHGPFDDVTLPLYRSIGRDAAIIAISRRQAALAHGVPIAAVIHHGVEVDDFPIGRGDGGHVVFLGRMAPTKGPHVAARVARAAGVPLLIAAKMREPAERRYFEREVRPLLGQGIEYIGEVDHAGKLELLAGASALLNPLQWEEPFGMVMLEALACGTPVIATPRGAAPEIVDHGRTGLLCPDEEALVCALALVDGLSREACRRDARVRFSAARMAADHVAVYEQAGRGATSRPTIYQSEGRPTTTSMPGGRPSIRTDPCSVNTVTARPATTTPLIVTSPKLAGSAGST